MIEYPKIQTIYKRTEHGELIVGQYSLEEFAYLADNPWIATEKVDGTNIRVMWDGEKIVFGGRTSRAQLPVFLYEKLEAIFRTDEMYEGLTATFGSDPACLYGEGYGAKIQKGGGNYIPDGVGFILFDIRVGDWWLKWDDVTGIAGALGVVQVPEICPSPGDLFTLNTAIDYVRPGMQSVWGDFQAEGLVLRPLVPLTGRNGKRIMAKIKCKDFNRIWQE